MQVVFENVVKKYGDVTAVDSFNLKIEDGALHFLLGPSGCGKTTVLRMLAGLEPISSGRILLGGKDVTKMTPSERKIGMVFQNYALWPHMTVTQNIEFGLKVKKQSAKQIEAKVHEVLELTQLSKYKARLPGQLSGGQQQRVALARALAISPSILLLDEPLSNLDAKLRLEMRENISQIHRHSKVTMLYVTHDQKEALSMGSYITVMKAGEIIQSGKPKELYRQPINSFLAAFIGETNLVSGTVIHFENKNCVVDTALGKLNGTAFSTFKTGDKIVCSIRPEALKLKPESTQSNKLSLKLDRETYLGELEQLEFKYENNKTFKASVFEPIEGDLPEGRLIDVFIEPCDIAVFVEN